MPTSTGGAGMRYPSVMKKSPSVPAILLLLSAFLLEAQAPSFPLLAAGMMPGDGGRPMAAVLARGKAAAWGPGQIQSVAVRNGRTYAAGACVKEQTGTAHACLWIDGARTELEPSAPSQTTGLAFLDAAVCVSGGVRRGSAEVPCWWKDGVRMDLDDGGAEEAWTTGIAVKGSRVIVSGNLRRGPNTNACLWEDGKLVVLCGPGRYCYSRAVAVCGGEVVLVGAERRGGKTAACLWRDGIQETLAVPGSADAANVAAIGAAADGGRLFVLVQSTGSGVVRSGYLEGPRWTEASVDVRPPAESAVLARTFRPSCIAAWNGKVYVAGQMSERTEEGETVIGCLAWSEGKEYPLPPLLYVLGLGAP